MLYSSFPFKVFDFIRVFHAVCNLLGLFSFTVILLSHSSAGITLFLVFFGRIVCCFPADGPLGCGYWTGLGVLGTVLLGILVRVSFCDMLKNFSGVYPWG